MPWHLTSLLAVSQFQTPIWDILDIWASWDPPPMVKGLLDGRCSKIKGPNKTRSKTLQETKLQMTPAPWLWGPAVFMIWLASAWSKVRTSLGWLQNTTILWVKWIKVSLQIYRKVLKSHSSKNGDRKNEKKSSQNSGPSLWSTSKNRGNFNGHLQGQTGRDSETMGDMFLQYSWDLFGEKRQKHDKNWNLTHTKKMKVHGLATISNQ